MWKFMSTRPATVSPAMSAAATTKQPTRRHSDARSAGSPSTSGDRSAAAPPVSLEKTSRRHGVDRGPDRTAHAGAAEAAVSGRILGEILLMIILGKIEVRGGQDLCRDGTVPSRGERLLVHRLGSLCGRALRGRVHVDAGPVLGADVVALPHALSRVMTLPEGLQQRLVGNLLRVEHNQDDLIVAGLAGTNFLIGGIWGETARVADRRDVNPVPQFPEFPFSAPEATQAEDRALKAFRIRPLEWAAIDKMARCRWDRFLAAGQRCSGVRHLKLFLEREHPDLLVNLAGALRLRYKPWRAVSHALQDHNRSAFERRHLARHSTFSRCALAGEQGARGAPDGAPQGLTTIADQWLFPAAQQHQDCLDYARDHDGRRTE